MSVDQRIKAIIFRDCYSCPFSLTVDYNDGTHGLCCDIVKNPNWWWSNWSSVDHTKEIDNPVDIPKWCPLPDIVEVVEDLDSGCEFKPYWD